MATQYHSRGAELREGSFGQSPEGPARGVLQVQPPEWHSLGASPWGADPPHWRPSLAWSLSCYPSLQEGRGRATRESLCPLPATWKPWLSHRPPKGKDWPQGRKAGARWWQECVWGAGTAKPVLPCPTAEVPPAQPGVLQAGPTHPQQDRLFLPSFEKYFQKLPYTFHPNAPKVHVIMPHPCYHVLSPFRLISPVSYVRVSCKHDASFP